MLKLRRYHGQSVVIKVKDEIITIYLSDLEAHRASLTIHASRHCQILRGEIDEKNQAKPIGC